MILEKVQDPRDYRNIPNMEVAVKVGKAVMTLWNRINPRMEKAMVKEKEVVRKVFTLWERLEFVSSGGKKKAKGKKKRGKQEKMKEDFVSDLDRLFDICSCHCPILSCADSGCPTNCQANVHIKCSCVNGLSP